MNEYMEGVCPIRIVPNKNSWGQPAGYKKGHNEHWSVCVFLNYGFLRVYVQVWECCVVW